MGASACLPVCLGLLLISGCDRGRPRAAEPQAPPPIAASLPPVDVAAIAHTCAGCHGTGGRVRDSAFVPLAGLPADRFVATMKDFRSGKRPSTLMGHVAKGFLDRDIEAMGAYFAALPAQDEKGGRR